MDQIRDINSGFELGKNMLVTKLASAGVASLQNLDEGTQKETKDEGQSLCTIDGAAAFEARMDSLAKPNSISSPSQGVLNITGNEIDVLIYM